MRATTELAPGDHAYRLADPFFGFVAVRSGWLKTYYIDNDGTEQVSSFVAGGELAGLEGLEGRTYKNSAIALCGTSFCILDIDDFTEVCKNRSDVLREFLTRFGTALRNQEVLASNYTATEKLAAFLIDLLARSDVDPADARTFLPPMTHEDIANYLAIAPETLSRRIQHLIKMDLIANRGRRLVITDPVGLRRVADGALLD